MSSSDNVVHLQDKKVHAKAAPAVGVPLRKPLNLTTSTAGGDQFPSHPQTRVRKRDIYRRWRTWLRPIRDTRRLAWEQAIHPLRDRWYRRRGDCLLSKLVRRSRQLNRPDFHVFLHISGHVDTFDLSIHPGGWKKEPNAVFRLSHVYLPGYSRHSTTKPRDIEDIIRMLEALSRLNHLQSHH